MRRGNIDQKYSDNSGNMLKWKVIVSVLGIFLMNYFNQSVHSLNNKNEIDAYFQITPAGWGFGANYLKISLEKWGKSVSKQLGKKVIVKNVRDNSQLVEIMRRNRPFVGLVRPATFFEYMESEKGSNRKLIILGQLKLINMQNASVCTFRGKDAPLKNKKIFYRGERLGIGFDGGYIYLRKYFRDNLKGILPEKYFKELKPLEDPVSGLAAVKAGLLDVYLMRDNPKAVLQKILKGKMDIAAVKKHHCFGKWPNAVFVSNQEVTPQENKKLEAVILNPKNHAMKNLSEYLNLSGVKIGKPDLRSIGDFGRLYRFARNSGWLKDYELLKK